MWFVMEFIIAIVGIIYALYYLYTRNYNYWKSRGVPYEKPVFLFGNLGDVVMGKKHFSQLLRDIYNKYKNEPYLGVFYFNQPNLFVRNPDIIKRILVKDFDKFVNRTIATNESADPIAFHNLPSAKDKTWKNLRSKLSPIFSSGKMKLMFPLIKEQASNLTNFLDKNNGQNIEIQNTMKKFAVDVISSCAFGINSNCLKHNNSEIFDMASKLLDQKSLKRNLSVMCFFFVPKLVDIFKLTFTDKKAAHFFIDIFKTTANTREQQNIVRNDLIDCLTKLKKEEKFDDDYKFDDIKMAARAIVFFSAGNETTSLTLSFALYELASNQNIQNRLRAELNKYYEKNDELTYETLHSIKYLDMVWKETLRKYPLTSFLNREASADYTIEETGFVIEKGLSIRIPISGLHYDPQYYLEPEVFNPERFSDENKHNIKPYTYLPFGDGPRICIGERFATLTGKTALAYTIKNFFIECSDKTIPLELRPGIFMTSKHGIWLKTTKITE